MWLLLAEPLPLSSHAARSQAQSVYVCMFVEAYVSMIVLFVVLFRNKLFLRRMFSETNFVFEANVF